MTTYLFLVLLWILDQSSSCRANNDPFNYINPYALRKISLHFRSQGAVTCGISVGTCPRTWSSLGLDMLPVQHHWDWSVSGAHSTVCATLRGIPSSHHTFFGIRGASVRGQTLGVWVVLYTASRPLSLVPLRGHRPGHQPTLPFFVPSWTTVLVPNNPEVIKTNGNIFFLVNYIYFISRLEFRTGLINRFGLRSRTKFIYLSKKNTILTFSDGDEPEIRRTRRRWRDL